MRVFVPVLIVALAGCFDATPAGGEGAQDGSGIINRPFDRPDYPFETAIVGVHDHGDPSLHTASYGFELVGYTPMQPADVLLLGGGYTEVATAGDHAYVANWGPHRAFSIVDISEPSDLRHVGDWGATVPQVPPRVGASSSWDVSVFPEGDLAISSAQALAVVAGDEQGGGVYLVNVTDKSAPRLESFTQVIDPGALIPLGVHNAKPFTIDGQRYVSATTANGQTILFAVEGQPGQRTLREVSRVAGVHDATVQQHPLTGQWLIYGASGGVVLTDISDPANPEVIGTVASGPELEAYHLIVPSDVLIDGRHVTVSASEAAEGDPVIVTVLDTTDPNAPFITGTWLLPVPETRLPGAYRYTTHNFDVDAGRIYLGHYHAGVWVIDIASTRNIQSPVTAAFYQPHASFAIAPRTPFGTDVPAVWGAVRHTDGLVYLSDVNTGLYALRSTLPPTPWENETRWPTNHA